jgi:hypothetical protein
MDAIQDEKDKLFCIIVINHNILETCRNLYVLPTRSRGGLSVSVTWPWANNSSIFDLTPIPSRLMLQLERPTTASSSFAHSDYLASSLNAAPIGNLAVFDDPWILDSGAFYHMTGFSSLLSSYHLCSSKEKVRKVDDSLSMSLSLVLHVLNFEPNLLSIARITADLNYQAIFYLTTIFSKT